MALLSSENDPLSTMTCSLYLNENCCCGLRRRRVFFVRFSSADEEEIAAESADALEDLISPEAPLATESEDALEVPTSPETPLAMAIRAPTPSLTRSIWADSGGAKPSGTEPGS